jgi:predicted AAA+ superfamily ATPase
MEQYFSAGGFPRSLLAPDGDVSYEWRENFISTFLERDLLQWAGFTPATMRRLWQMLAHVNGQTVNYSALASSLGVSSVTVKSYIDLLSCAYMVEVIPPYFSNLGKRLVKAPKIYIADSGISAALLGLRSFEELSGHPAFGSIWEQMVLSNVRGWHPEAELFFYRTSNGSEADFVVKLGNDVFALECKASYSPVLSEGTYHAIEDIAPKHTFVVIPADTGWPMKEGIDVVSLQELKYRFGQ